MKMRWRIALLVSAAIAISYLDRQTLPVAIKAIERDIPVTNQDFSLLQTAFLLTYALMYAGGGKLMDWLGTRRGFACIMIFWSVACMSHSLATNFIMLAASRLLLGAGEGGGFPAATRVVAEWFPVKDRSTAMGIINGGSAIGMIAAPPLIRSVLSFAGWRWIFLATGAAGLLWTFWWWKEFFPPEQHPKLKPDEREEIRAELHSQNSTEAAPRWIELFSFRETWGIVLAKFITDAAWYFYLFWLPKYLYDARGFDIKDVGAFGWIPPAAAGVGCLCGGALSSWLIHRGTSVNLARKVVLAIAAAMMPLVFFVPSASITWVIVLFSVAYFGHQWWSTLVMILPTDLFSKKVVCAIAGLVGCAGALGGVAFGQLAGYLLDHGFGWTPIFALAGTFHIVGLQLILFLVPMRTMRRNSVESLAPLNSNSPTNNP